MPSEVVEKVNVVVRQLGAERVQRLVAIKDFRRKLKLMTVRCRGGAVAHAWLTRRR